ncbi:hypothetical protein TDB9533_03560 [Thalassocella blandensis]|nr:hypothetical protein TDB9533_03560 [Thalassocella blandensis]
MNNDYSVDWLNSVQVKSWCPLFLGVGKLVVCYHVLVGIPI